MKQKMEQMSDEELIQLIDSDEESTEKVFTELYNRYSPSVYAFCRRFLADSAEAQDAYQETFIRFHQSLIDKKRLTNVLGFMLTIARNICLNEKRRATTTVEYTDYMSIRYENRNEKDELLNLIKSSLDLLPDTYKEMFILREYDGMSYAEISEITGYNLNTVKVKLFRAKKKLRNILEPYLADYDLGNNM